MKFTDWTLLCCSVAARFCTSDETSGAFVVVALHAAREGAGVPPDRDALARLSLKVTLLEVFKILLVHCHLLISLTIAT